MSLQQRADEDWRFRSFGLTAASSLLSMHDTPPPNTATATGRFSSDAAAAMLKGHSRLSARHVGHSAIAKGHRLDNANGRKVRRVCENSCLFVNCGMISASEAGVYHGGIYRRIGPPADDATA